MNLEEIRQWFVKDSGRYDLVVDTTDWADNGADKYIAAGQRWLDRQVTMLGQYGKFFRELSSGSYLLSVSGLRSVRQVHVRESSGNVYALTRSTYEDLREIYGEDISEITSSDPYFYAIVSLRQHDEADSDPPDTEGLTDAAWMSNEGLLILPPPSEAVTVIVEGKFSSTTLVDDEDENFWSVNEPSVLVKAGLRELEAFYRNTAGVNDWTNSIMHDLVGIEKDYIEKSFGYIDQMEG
jgi:hypothetical protein